jgi:hypothetical protein
MIPSQISQPTLMMIIPRHVPLPLHPVPLVLHPIRPCTPCNPWQYHVKDLRACAVASDPPTLQQGTWTVALRSELQINVAFCGIIRILWIPATNCMWLMIPHKPHKALGIFVSLLIPQWVTSRSNAIGHPPCLPPSCLHMPLVLSSAAVVILCTMISRALAAQSSFTTSYVGHRASHCPCPYALASSLRRPSLPLLMLNVLLPFLVPSFTLFYTPMPGRDRFTILHCLKPGRALMTPQSLKPGWVRYCISCMPPANLGESTYVCLDPECPCATQSVSQELDSYCLPCDTLIDLPTPDPPPTYVIRHLIRNQLRILWHQCLGHLHNQRMKLVSRAATGVPDLATDDKLHKCPVCMAAKLRKTNKGTKDSRRATVCNQGVSIDAGFIVQCSRDSKQTQHYTGLNGETCYFTIVDHKSTTIYGEKCASRAPPIEFVN